MLSDTLVIIPTYNEAHNIGRIIDRLMNLDLSLDVLIVDDGSPDDTSGIVKHKQTEFSGRIHLIEREEKLGLGTAYVQGFKYALSHDYQYVCEMDADFSHSPEDVPKLVNSVRSEEADIAIGSRYARGISIVNWPLRRLILSYAANIYARVITGVPIKDMTAGFKCIRRKVLESIDIDKIKSNGYAFQIEIHFRAYKAGFNLKEVSIIFREREVGLSKMSKTIVREAVWRVWLLRLQSIFGKL